MVCLSREARWVVELDVWLVFVGKNEGRNMCKGRARLKLLKVHGEVEVWKQWKW